MNQNNTEELVITRFPPSPTGYLHIGRARTLLFNYLFTKQKKGKMIFRLEDTDVERSKKEFEENIIDSLKWLGIECDEGPYRQSERKDIYKKYLNQMVEEGKAYISEEVEGERSQVIRFKNPNKKIVFNDIIRGEVEFDTSDLKDFVIAKSLEEPLYHLAVVVDDFLMGITHVIRGEDGISNTPRQILIQEAIGAPRPSYAHIPLILASDRSKLSGRHGAVSVTEYRDKGYLPSALINYLALLGWNPGGDQEIFTLDELIEKFKIENVQKGGAIFDEKKLRWMNKEHLKRIPDYGLQIIEELKKYYPDASEKILKKITPVVFERIEVLGDVGKMVEEGELQYFFSRPEYDYSKLSWKGITPPQTKEYLEHSVSLLQKINEDNFTEVELKNVLFPYATEVGKGSVLWPMRYALSGKDKSPDPFTLCSILGKEETLERMKIGIEKIS